MMLAALGGVLVSLASPVTVVSDPVNGAASPMTIPGALVEYAITVTNASGVTLSSSSVNVVNAIPANTKLYVKDIGVAGRGPVTFTAGASGLTYNFVSLTSTADNLDFSNDGGITYSYAPVADANGYDVAVTNIRVRPQGTDGVAGVFQVKFRVGVK